MRPAIPAEYWYIHHRIACRVIMWLCLHMCISKINQESLLFRRSWPCVCISLLPSSKQKPPNTWIFGYQYAMAPWPQPMGRDLGPSFLEAFFLNESVRRGYQGENRKPLQGRGCHSPIGSPLPQSNNVAAFPGITGLMDFTL